MSEPPIGPTLDELIAAVEARTHGVSSIDRLIAAVTYSDELHGLEDKLVGHFVSVARADGASWARIGTVLGVSKQGARERFSRAEPLRAGDFNRGIRFDLFSPQATRVLADAQKHAYRLRHDAIGTEHLLLGIIDLKRATATRALDAVGVPPATVRERIEARHPAGETELEGHRPFSAPAERALELSMQEALKLGHNYIGTEHLILAVLIEPDGLAGQVLRGLGVDYEPLRAKQIELIRQHGSG